MSQPERERRNEGTGVSLGKPIFWEGISGFLNIHSDLVVSASENPEAQAIFWKNGKEAHQISDFGCVREGEEKFVRSLAAKDLYLGELVAQVVIPEGLLVIQDRDSKKIYPILGQVPYLVSSEPGLVLAATVARKIDLHTNDGVYSMTLPDYSDINAHTSGWLQTERSVWKGGCAVLSDEVVVDDKRKRITPVARWDLSQIDKELKDKNINHKLAVNCNPKYLSNSKLVVLNSEGNIVFRFGPSGQMMV